MTITIQGHTPDPKNSHIFSLLEGVVQKLYTGKPLLIGIAGAGGAGKTTLATNLCTLSVRNRLRLI